MKGVKLVSANDKVLIGIFGADREQTKALAVEKALLVELHSELVNAGITEIVDAEGNTLINLG